VKFLQEEYEGTCKGCALGKNVKKPFARSDTIYKGVLDLIHLDVCGPMAVKSLGGHQYYVTFIDDFLRKTWLYLLNNKDEVFKKFQDLKNEMENLTERKITTLRSDNDGEYTSKELIYFCKEEWIKREIIVPYNPEQNGTVDERKSRTIEEFVRAMLHDQDLPQFIWGRGMYDNCLLVEPKSSRDSQQHESKRSIYKKEAKCGSSSNISVSCVYSYTQGQEREVGSYQSKGHICWV